MSVLTATSSNKGDASQSGNLDAIILGAIWAMTKKNFANQVAFAEANVIAPLQSLLGNASPELQLPATGVVECLLQTKDLQAAVVRTGAIAPLCMLSRGACSHAVLALTLCLLTLCMRTYMRSACGA